MLENPIKRSKHIFRLSKDHHFTLLFCWKIRQGLRNGIAAGRIKNYVHYFWSHDMQFHLRREDEILFVHLSNDNNVKLAMDQHVQIKDQVEIVLKSVDEERLADQLRLLADTIDVHVRYEERSLFPYLEKLLTEVQLQEIGSKLEEQPPLFDVYEDEFWVRRIKS